jgi:dynein light chain Tctex-type 1
MQALQSTLSDVSYDSTKVGQWSNAVIDSCLKGLTGLGRPFKYIVTAAILQRQGSPTHTAAGTYWDSKRDGMCKMAWENPTIHCIVTVFGLAIAPSAQITEA